MKKVILLAAICFVVFLTSNDAQAQRNRVGFMFGVASGDYGFDEVGIGGVAEFKVIEKGTISPQLIFYFPDGGNVMELNGNFNYYFYSKDVFEIYGLGGLNFLRASGGGDSNTELGLNLGGGVNFEIQEKFVPFAELRLTLGEFDQFVLGLGMKFNLN